MTHPDSEAIQAKKVEELARELFDNSQMDWKDFKRVARFILSRESALENELKEAREKYNLSKRIDAFDHAMDRIASLSEKLTAAEDEIARLKGEMEIASKACRFYFEEASKNLLASQMGDAVIQDKNKEILRLKAACAEKDRAMKATVTGPCEVEECQMCPNCCYILEKALSSDGHEITEALQTVLNVLGPKPCCKCEGCEAEIQIALDAVRRAMGRTE